MDQFCVGQHAAGSAHELHYISTLMAVARIFFEGCVVQGRHVKFVVPQHRGELAACIIRHVSAGKVTPSVLA